MKIDDSIFKSYDIRGTYPYQINNRVAYRIAQGFFKYLSPEAEILVGHDVRLHSEEIKNELIKGLVDCGVNVVDVGLISTDMSYFGVGFYNFAGALQSTASHNPPEWHGIKMTAKGVVPLTFEHGISQIRDFVVSGAVIEKAKGKLRKMDILEDYCKFILSFINSSAIKPMKVVINPNFGTAGIVFRKLVQMGKLPITIIGLNDTPDGNFPKGRPDPFIPENRTEFSELVKSTQADLGITWDADSDRVFFCADGGTFVDPYYLNTIIIKTLLQKNPGQKMIYDIRYTWALVDAINQAGGLPIECRVGHSYIKEKMREERAFFAAESSGHTYYRDFWYADCGMIPAVQILEYLSINNTSLSESINPVMNKYFISGEINSTVSDVSHKMEELARKYPDANQSKLDGITIEYPDYRFNVRPSNTEPLLRLNLEAKSKELVDKKTEEILDVIRS